MEGFVPKDSAYMANMVISNPAEMESITYGLIAYSMLITIGAVFLVYSIDKDYLGGRILKGFSHTRVSYAVGFLLIAAGFIAKEYFIR